MIAVARVAGVTQPTVARWIRLGWLGPGPWTRSQVEQAAQRSRQRAGRGSVAAHGTPSRWRAGCPCERCATAHNADVRERRETVRRMWWVAREEPLLELLASGVSYRDALAELGLTSVAVAAHRRRSPSFARRLDEALLTGRDPALSHGAAGGWRAGCRCPECRTYHDASRT